MATDLIPLSPTDSAGTAVRIPQIAANLLPAEIVQSRRTRRVRRRVLAALAVTLCLVVAWRVALTTQTVVARDRLDTAQEEVLRLQRQQNAFADLVRVQKDAKLIESQLAVLLASDLPWSTLLSSLRSAAPVGVKVTGVNGTLNGAATALGGTGGTATGGEQLPGRSGEKQVGTLTITGTGTDNRAVAAYVDALDAVRGLGNPLLTGTTREKGTLQFTVRVDITDQVLGGRYTGKNTNGSTGDGSAGN